MPKDGTGQSERSGTSHEIQRFVKFIIRVHVNGEEGTEYLFRHDLLPWILRLDNGGFNEVTDAESMNFFVPFYNLLEMAVTKNSESDHK